MADFYVGEYGETLTIPMPFDASTGGQVVAATLTKPDRTVVTWSAGWSVGASSVSRTIASGELNQPGTYHIVIFVTDDSPAMERIVPYDIEVATP